MIEPIVASPRQNGRKVPKMSSDFGEKPRHGGLFCGTVLGMNPR